jgi:hypothetical protein
VATAYLSVYQPVSRTRFRTNVSGLDSAHIVWVDPVRLSIALKKVAKGTLRLLSIQAGPPPHDWRLSDLIAELPTRSDELQSGGPPRRPDSHHCVQHMLSVTGQAPSPIRDGNVR